MTNKTQVTPTQAAEQLKSLLNEKLNIESEIDGITRVKKIILSDKAQGYDPKIMKVRVCAKYGHGESEFDINASILNEAAQAMLDKHAARLSEINDSLLFMVKLIK